MDIKWNNMLLVCWSVLLVVVGCCWSVGQGFVSGTETRVIGLELFFILVAQEPEKLFAWA